MEEKFYLWHKLKSRINELDSSNIYSKERDIWWCYFGKNIGHEQDGKGDKFLRPVLIIRKFTKNTCLIIPLSTQVKFGNYFFFLLSETNLMRVALLSQIKVIDSISTQEFNYIKEKVIDLIR